MNSNNSLKTFFLFISIFCIIFIPIRIGGSFIIGQAAYYAVIAISFLTLIIFGYIGVYKEDKINIGPIILTLILAIWITILTLLQSGIIISKDLFDVIRPFIYLFLFYIGYLNTTKLNINSFISYLLILFIVQVAFSSTVYIDSFSIFQDIYKGRTSTDSVIKHYYRFSGTFGFPGSFGSVISLFLIWYFLIVAIKPSLKNILIFTCFVIALLLSGSRGAIIVLFPLIFLLSLKYRLFKVLIIILFLFILICILVMHYFNIDLHAITYILELTEKGLDEGSLIYRLGELGLTYDILKDTLLIGVGSHNSYFVNIHGPIESLYLNYLGRYGIIGFLLITFATFMICSKININNMIGITLETKLFISSFTYWFFLSIFIGGISTSIIDQMKISAFVFVLIGVFYKVIMLNTPNQKHSINYLSKED